MASKVEQMCNAPPVAIKLPHKVRFGRFDGQNRGKDPMDPPTERHDNYFWLRDDTRKDPEVLKHLSAENEYTKIRSEHRSSFEEQLYKEMVGHMKETDVSVPYRQGSYLYYSRTVEGMAYRIYCRKPALKKDSKEQILLDVNKLADGKKYCVVNEVIPSPGHDLIAFSVDFCGDETYEIIVIRPGAPENDHFCAPIAGTSGNFVWGRPGKKELFYLTMDQEHRPYRLYYHQLEQNQHDDKLLYEEKDQEFWMHLFNSGSKRFVFTGIETKTTSEFRFLDLQCTGDGLLKLKTIQSRVDGLRYSPEHHGEHLFIITNDCGRAQNGKLVSCALSGKLSSDQWEDVIQYDAARTLTKVYSFKAFLVVSGREDGLKRMWTFDIDSKEFNYIPQPEEAYAAHPEDNFEFDCESVRFSYSSLVSPISTVEYNVQTKERRVLKEKDVPNYDRSLYACRRLQAPARSTMIPISIVFRSDIHRGVLPENAACMLYGYGSYGSCTEPNFSFTRLCYLDRGAVYAIAHIRGGSEMGRSWYEDQGKFLTKKNTFEDFIQCAKYLVDEGIVSKSQLSCTGRSAGGLLIGAVVNMAPSLFCCAIADVPFVDVMNTMSDPTIPLTVAEYAEWGNPNEEKFHNYIASYSPYDNVTAQDYPPMLITGGLFDPRVAYWEPAKFVAKLREFKTDSNDVLLKIDMSAGHFSASDRYKYLKEAAFEFAFALEKMGCSIEPIPPQ